jgi:uncharacterized protein YndB with AHSA1/START domain
MTAKTLFTIEPGKPTVVIRRAFDAPPHLVFAALTTPEHIARWYGWRDSTLSECRVDLRPGGAWRFVVRMPDGSEHGFGGVYREIVRPERLVYTLRYDGFPDAEAVETITLVEQNGKTLMTNTLVHESVANRDGHVASGMEAGATESLDRLDELLGSMQRAAHRSAANPRNP